MSLSVTCIISPEVHTVAGEDDTRHSIHEELELIDSQHPYCATQLRSALIGVWEGVAGWWAHEMRSILSRGLAVPKCPPAPPAAATSNRLPRRLLIDMDVRK